MQVDAYGAEYYAARESWHDWQLEANELIRLARLTRGARALEIGCGSGGLLKLLEPIVSFPVGVDTQLSALELARGRQNPKLRAGVVQIAASELLPFAADTFDAILAQHVLEHISDLDNALCEFRRVLKAEGRLEIATPNALYPDPAHFHDDDHVQVLGPDELVSRVRHAGFAIEAVTTIFPYLTGSRLLRAAGVRLYRLFRLLPYYSTRGRTLVLSGTAVK